MLENNFSYSNINIFFSYIISGDSILFSICAKDNVIFFYMKNNIGFMKSYSKNRRNKNYKNKINKIKINFFFILFICNIRNKL